MTVPPQGKLLALDVGLARIGVAVCDGLQLTVRPLTVVYRHSRNEDFAQLALLARRQDVQAIICGLPLNMDGSEGPQAQTTREMGNAAGAGAALAARSSFAGHLLG